MNHTNTGKCHSWLKANGKRKIQSFQDSYADLLEISLGIIGLDGKSLTVWSNSSLFCHFIRKNNDDRCRCEKQRIIDYVDKKREPIKYTCYMQVTYFALPIFFKGDLIAICLGGGVFLEEHLQKENQITPQVPVFSEAKLNDLIKLLENVFHLLDTNEEEKFTAENNKDESGQELFFLKNKLTIREIDVVKLINSGLTNKEISVALNISEKTVKTHITNILRKLNMKDRLDIIIFCRNNTIK